MAEKPRLALLFSRAAPPIGLGADNTWRPLRFLNLYRFTIAALFVLIYQVNEASLPPPLGILNPTLFYATSVAYLCFSLLSMIFIGRRQPDFNLQRNTHVLADIVFITLLMYTSGGVSSGVGMLLVINIAYASMISVGRGPLFFAALASVTVLLEEGYLLLSHDTVEINYSQAGLLGMALFATAIVVHILARRARVIEELAVQRGADLANMAELTEYTIQQMSTGVLVVGPDYRVRLINDAALKLLGSPETPPHSFLNEYCYELNLQLHEWQQGELSPGKALTPTQGPHELLPQYLEIGGEHSGGTLIFLEDASAATQKAQQLKLASLGRLTASIAHEIRNPLGAIGHAADLLAEAPELAEADQRLTTIIKSHTQRINAIVEDILQLGRRDKSNQEVLFLAKWLAEFCRDFLDAEGEPAETMSWQCEQTIQAYFDPNHLRQILTNLCHNGLRHAQEAPNPRVELIAGIIDEGWGYLDIVDHGPGIPEPKRANIFEPFFTTEKSGTGLGLYIARELSVCNNSQLRYEPTQDINSRFRLHFPRQRRNVD